MKAVLLGGMAVVLAVAANSAYADDFAASLQESIDTMTDQRNDYLIEKFFGESYPAPRTAAVETVKSAIELYELTIADPYVPVTEQGTFTQRPISPYGASVVAFDVINSMNTDMEVYPFVVEADALRIVAEGAFPATVGLSALFLNDADRPWEDILEDLQESDGVWVTYDFPDHKTGTYGDKSVWLSLHDGHIFGAGYYEAPDDVVLSRVGAMVRMYDTNGTDSFAAIPVGAGVSFVLDAGTLEVVAHTGLNTSGSAVRDALDTNWPLASLTGILTKHGSLWVSYPATEPQPGGEYVRAYLRLHDGHIFGSGYWIAAESRLQSLVDEAVQLYELEGEDAYPVITSLAGTGQAVTELGGKILAFAGWPFLVGVTPSSSLFDRNPDELLRHLETNPGLWMDSSNTNPLAPADEETRFSYWVSLRDELVFSAARTYSPEAASVDAVGAAIELYKAHGEGAFDRITLQSAVPQIIYPFVFDADTWRTVAHAAYPDRLGLLPAAIMADHDLGEISEMLAESEGVWVSYKFYNPITSLLEYKRTWLSTHDGYTFAAGYYYGNFDEQERTIRETIDLYNEKGRDAAFADINAMMAPGLDYPFVLDRETLEIVAHGQKPGLVGTNLADKSYDAHLPVARIKANLHNDGDTTIGHYGIPDPATGISTGKSTLFQLHDGYVFAAGQQFAFYSR